jgi:hypothetical protein
MENGVLFTSRILILMASKTSPWLTAQMADMAAFLTGSTFLIAPEAGLFSADILPG